MEKVTIKDVIKSSGVKFGTSGVRGLVSAMTDKICWLYTKAFIQFLEEKFSFIKGSKIAIAHDLRDSSPRITSAVIRAVEDSGYDVIFCGEIPSPAIMSYGLEKNIPSIMITGSHIPEDRNGIKFNTHIGEILKDDEQIIVEQGVGVESQIFDDQGQFIEKQPLSKVDKQAYSFFIQRYTNFFPENCLKSKRIGLYEHSSVARSILKDILVELGADVTLLGFSNRFVSVDTEAIRSEDIELAKQWIKEYGFDSVVSTDGDGDRPLISDELGNWLKGDVVGVLTAKYLGITSIVTPVSSNSLVEKSGLFNEVVRTKIGSPFVIEEINKLLKDAHKKVMGYEANGGVLLGSSIYCGDTIELTPLATRDAILPILAILVLSIRESKTVSQLVDELPRRYTESSKIDNYAVEKSTILVAELKSGNSEIISKVIAEYFKNAVKLVDVNITDGVRLTFSNEDILHFRASGNAPELRCYTESSSYKKAHALNMYATSLIVVGGKADG